jgi:hypothetical protein
MADPELAMSTTFTTTPFLCFVAHSYATTTAPLPTSSSRPLDYLRR